MGHFPLAEFQAFSFKQDYSYLSIALSCCKIEKEKSDSLPWDTKLGKETCSSNFVRVTTITGHHESSFSIFSTTPTNMKILYTSPLLHLTTIFNIVFVFVIHIVESLRRFCHSERDKNDQTAACPIALLVVLFVLLDATDHIASSRRK